MRFRDRSAAGRLLAQELEKYKTKDTIVLALPRGGVPVGFEVARFLRASFSVIVARKISMSGDPEFGVGAISEGGVEILDKQAIGHLRISKEALESEIAKEREELVRRVNVYRGGEPLPRLSGHTVILVDDGLATGVTARAAIEAIRKMRPGRLVVAFPVCASDMIDVLRRQVDDLICLLTPLEFRSVGGWYQDFQQVSDEEVVELLEKAREFRDCPW